MLKAKGSARDHFKMKSMLHQCLKLATEPLEQSGPVPMLVPVFTLGLKGSLLGSPGVVGVLSSSFLPRLN